MLKIEKILKAHYEKCKNFDFSFEAATGHAVLRILYLYNKTNNVVIGVMLKKINEKKKIILDSVYLFDNKKNVYSYNGKKVENVEDVDQILSIPRFNRLYEEDFINSFCKLWGPVVFLKSSQATYLDSENMIRAFYNFKELQKTTGKVQKKIDELTSRKLKEYNIKDFTVKSNYSSNMGGLYWVSADSSCKIEMVKDNMFVIRMFVLCKKANEIFRIYVDGDKIYKCRRNNIGDWVSATKISTNYFAFGFDANDITEEFKNTKMWYMKDIFNNINIKSIKLVINFIEDNTLEQLYRIGFSSILNKLSYTIVNKGGKDFIEWMFGYFNPKGKNMYQKLGVNSYQLNRILEYLNNLKSLYHDDLTILYCARTLFGEDISHIDNESFDRILNFLLNIRKDNMRYSTYTVNTIIRELKKLNISNAFIFNLLEKFVDKQVFRDYTRVYRDYLVMLSQTEDEIITKDVLDFDCEREIMTKHDILVEVFNAKKDEENSKKFGKRKKLWEEWTYENDKFAICYPTTTTDIANEGLVLRHCVKSYIPNVLRGETNILFLRKKEEINAPYFTIEVENDGKIRQIHGFCNSNINKKSEEYYFLLSWVKEKKLDMKNINRVLAAG